MGTPAIDLLGQRFGRLVVTGRNDRKDRRQPWWDCVCDCGNTCTVVSSQLRTGRTKSCGCLRNDAEALKQFPTSTQSYGAVYSRYKHDAKKRGLSFNLSQKLFLDLILDRCYYCGSTPEEAHRKRASGGLAYNGVDRLNNTIGYEAENVVSCCYDCNSMKSTQTEQDFARHISKIYNHLFGKKSTKK